MQYNEKRNWKELLILLLVEFEQEHFYHKQKFPILWKDSDPSKPQPEGNPA